MATSIVWFRRDLRLRDHRALAAAAAAGDVVGLFVVDPALWRSAGPARRAWLASSVRALSGSTGGALVVRVGDTRTVVPSVASEARASAVHVTGETTPYGRARDESVRTALATVGVGWEEHGTPYAVDPGTVLTRQGRPYQVFTPFGRAWRERGWDAPGGSPDVAWRPMAAVDDATACLGEAVSEAPTGMPDPGEDAAHARWQAFLAGALEDYDAGRDLPAVDGTSRMSPYLKVGAVHPRQLLATLPAGADGFVAELGWREFHADVLWHRPESAWRDLRPLGIRYDDPGDALDAWRTGHTGYPIVDAGMRQLLHAGWMHNRVRMITASFLTKDLHAWWPVGARHFLDHLVDGDLASNNHGWQWVAGTGTDAAPYFRVFNPVTQGRTFDPDGGYVRRWVPELAHLPGAAAHEPWRHADGYAHGYPVRIVDHDEERRDALARYGSRSPA